MTPAIVLAAGASSRMGRPKPLLEAGGRTFIRRILETLRDGGVPEAVVVIRAGHEQVAEEVQAVGFGSTVLNPRPEEGQLSSLIVGLDAIDRPGVDAVLVTLVDVPLIGSGAVGLLLARAATSTAPVLRAVHAGRHGHPVIFKRELFDALRKADPATGAKPIVRAVRVEDVETGDPGVVEDVDTPEEYARLFGRGAVNHRPSNP